MRMARSIRRREERSGEEMRGVSGASVRGNTLLISAAICTSMQVSSANIPDPPEVW